VYTRILSTLQRGFQRSSTCAMTRVRNTASSFGHILCPAVDPAQVRHVQGDLCAGLTVADQSGSEGEISKKFLIHDSSF